MSHLLWVLRQPLDALLAKGELIPRYYNPENRATHVTLLTIGRSHGAAPVEWAGSASWSVVSLPRWGLLWPDHVRLPQLPRPDLIRAGAGPEGWIAARLAKHHKCALALSVHADRERVIELAPRHERWRRRRDLRWTRASLERAHRTAYVSRDLACYCPNGRLLYNMIGLAPPERPTSPGLIVCVGAPDRYRDPVPLIEALSLMKTPGRRLIWIGEGERRRAGMRAARDLGVSHLVTWVPAMGNTSVLNLMAAAHVVWNPTGILSKPHLEALMCGKAAVSPHGGPEVAELGYIATPPEHRADLTDWLMGSGPHLARAAIGQREWYRNNYVSPEAAESRWAEWMWSGR